MGDYIGFITAGIGIMGIFGLVALGIQFMLGLFKNI